MSNALSSGADLVGTETCGRYGAEVATITGTSVSDTLVDYANRHNISKIVRQ